jgi:hypothetical protein
MHGHGCGQRLAQARVRSHAVVNDVDQRQGMLPAVSPWHSVLPRRPPAAMR